MATSAFPKVSEPLRVALTGANGRLGHATRVGLERAGVHVTSIVRPGSSSDSTLSAGRPSNVREIDLLQPEQLRAAVSGVDWLVHAAGKKSSGGVQAQPNEALAEAVGHACQEGPAVINMSSVAVYGEVDARVIDEYAACNPVSAYGRSKLRAEQILDERAGSVCHLRIANVYSSDTFAPLQASARQRVIRANEVSNLVLAHDVAGLIAHLVTNLDPSELPPVVNVVRSDIGHLPNRKVVGPKGAAGALLRLVPSRLPHFVRRCRGVPSLPNKVFTSVVVADLNFDYSRFDCVAPSPWPPELRGR